ncbi:SUKH-4 family immunity protein [Streptomyces sp. PA03-6a]|nr:SUKH-4 family immunity protein [Streptomyces sp. PA03-6a]
MSLEQTHAHLVEVFGPEAVVRVPEDSLNPAITHRETRRFLAGAGLPDPKDFLFGLEPGVAGGMRLAGEVYEFFGDMEDLPRTSDSWVFIGWIGYDDGLVVDGVDGSVHALPQGESLSEPLHPGLAELAEFLTVLYEERANYADGTDRRLREETVERITARFRSVDPGALADEEGTYTRLLESIAEHY